MKLLDLFCGAGGAAMGYYRAGFDDITGVDINPMPRYPFKFIQADALEYLTQHGHEYDAIHASPPCQAYSATKSLTSHKYPLLIDPVRMAMKKTGKPYIIENVVGAPLYNPTLLCGAMFQIKTYRHRLFETSFPLPLIMHSGHGASSDRLHGPTALRPGIMATVVGHQGYKNAFRKWCDAMGIDWMKADELTEAIPPVYTEWIGERLLEAVNGN